MISHDSNDLESASEDGQVPPLYEIGSLGYRRCLPRLAAALSRVIQARSAGDDASDGAARDDPARRLTGNRGDPVVVLVVVDDREDLALGGRGDDQIGQPNTPLVSRT
jgi:hypothetical protein